MRLTEQEERIIEGNAKAISLSVSRYLAKSGVEKLKIRPPISIEERKIFLDLIYELKRIGVNLNQLTQDYNVSNKGKGTPPTIQELGNVAKDIQDLVVKISKKL